MAIGNESGLSVGSLNSQLGAVAVAYRNACQQIIDLAAIVNVLGASGLETLGFTTTDAPNFVTAANYLQTLAQVYYGTAAQPADFNFDNALAAARGGQ